MHSKNIELSQLEGSYSNSLGFKTNLKINSTNSSLIEFNFGNYSDFFTNEDFSLDQNQMSFQEVSADGSIVMKVAEMCDYDVCTESQGYVTLKRKLDGSYYLKVELETTYWDDDEGQMKVEEALEQGIENPALYVCMQAFPPIIGKNFVIDDAETGNCTANADFYMKKD